jgi:hypothetical protein
VEYQVKTNSGELAEWSKAAVLKTVDEKSSGGSNPSLSAKNISLILLKDGAFLYVGFVL